MIRKNLIDCIGRTPLVELNNLDKEERLHARIAVKLESFNPGGSAKDRAAIYMIRAAEADGSLKPGGVIVEPTSGNTGIALAWIGRILGYRVILTMPESMSEERRKLLKAYGAELVLTSAAEGMKGAIDKAEELLAELPGAVRMRQFENPANPKAHELTTAIEIWNDTGGDLDIYVAGVGTAGTLCGVAKKLHQLKPKVEIVAVEPAKSAVLEGKPAGPHKIMGIGAGFVPKNYVPELVDKVMDITDDEARDAARLLVRTEGILAGISSGASLATAIKLAKKRENKGKLIVAVLPDTGERYLSTDLFE